MASLRHSLAHFGWLQVPLAGVTILASLGCPPERNPTVAVRAVATPVADGEVHFVVRADAALLARVTAISLSVSTARHGVAILPDDPELMGVTASDESNDGWLDAAPALGAGCPATGPCEAGFTVFVEPDELGMVADTVTLNVSASSRDDTVLPEGALELQVDGEATVVAERTW